MTPNKSLKPQTDKSQPRSSGHPLLTGLLIGLVLGVGLCSSVAIWIARSPSPFTNRALQTMGILKSSGSASTSGNGGGESEFRSPPGEPANNSADPHPNLPSTATAPSSSGISSVPSSPPPESSAPIGLPGEATPFNATKNIYVQVGAFSSLDEAQKQVEVVALLTGQKAHIWPPASGEAGKGWYRVRMGAFAQNADTNELTQILKSNGIGYTLVRPAAGESP